MPLPEKSIYPGSDGSSPLVQERGSLRTLREGQSQFIGSSTGVFFVNTVRRAFADAEARLSSVLGDQAHPFPEDCIVPDEDDGGPGRARSGEGSAVSSRAPSARPGAHSYGPGIPTDLGRPPPREVAKELFMTYFHTWHRFFPFLNGPTVGKDLESLYTTAEDGNSLSAAAAPTQQASDLFKTNASIIHDIFTEVVKTCLLATCCVVTNPVNSTVPVGAEALHKGAPTFIAHALSGDADPEAFKVPVIGGHSGVTILPLYSQAEPKVNVDAATLANVIRRVQFGGDEIVQSKQGAGSATTCMAYAGFRFVKALLEAKQGKSVTEGAYVYLPGVPGGKEIAAKLGVDYFAVKINLGVNGATKALDIGTLSENEQHLLEVAVKDLRTNIQAGQAFMTA